MWTWKFPISIQFTFVQLGETPKQLVWGFDFCIVFLPGQHDRLVRSSLHGRPLVSASKLGGLIKYDTCINVFQPSAECLYSYCSQPTILYIPRVNRHTATTAAPAATPDQTPKQAPRKKRREKKVIQEYLLWQRQSSFKIINLGSLQLQKYYDRLSMLCSFVWLGFNCGGESWLLAFASPVANSFHTPTQPTFSSPNFRTSKIRRQSADNPPPATLLEPFARKRRDVSCKQLFRSRSTCDWISWSRIVANYFLEKIRMSIRIFEYQGIWMNGGNPALTAA